MQLFVPDSDDGYINRLEFQGPLSCTGAIDGSFDDASRYEAVEFVLVDGIDEHTVSGTFTTDCNNCFADVVNWELHVEGPLPFTFTPANSQVFAGQVRTTPADISLGPRGSGNPEGLFITGPDSSALSFLALADEGSVSYNPPNRGPISAGFSLDDNDRFVIGTFILEPTSGLLVLFAASFGSLLRIKTSQSSRSKLDICIDLRDAAYSSLAIEVTDSKNQYRSPSLVPSTQTYFGTVRKITVFRVCRDPLRSPQVSTRYDASE